MERAFGIAFDLAGDGEATPSATVTVYDAGTANLSTIKADNSGTAKANPFTADTNAYWFFYAANGRYDVVISGAGITAPYTLADYILLDSASGILLSINASVVPAQTLVVGTAGTDFAIASVVGTGVHTFNLPNAGAAARGVVSTGAQTFAGAKTFSTPVAAGSGGSGVDASAAANGKLLIGNGAGFTLANLTAGANAGVTITNGAGSITLSTVQDIRTTAGPSFATLTLTAAGTLMNLTGLGATSGGILTVTPAGVVSFAEMGDGDMVFGRSLNSPFIGSLQAGSGITLTFPGDATIIDNTGVLSINTVAFGAITFITSAAGTDVAIKSGAGQITLQIPSASDVARGVVTTGAQTITGLKTFLYPPKFVPGSAAAATLPIRVQGTLVPDLTGLGNTGAGVDLLASVGIPANALDYDGGVTGTCSGLRITAWGDIASNANSKDINLKFGATVVARLFHATLLNGLTWVLSVVLYRTTATTQLAIGWGQATKTVATAPVLVDTRATTPAETLSAAVSVTVTGEAVADNDIVCKGLSVEIL